MNRIARVTLLFACSTAPALAAPPAAAPGQLRFVEELRVEPTKDGTRIGAELQPLSQRFIKVGMEWERDANTRARRPRFKLLDLAQRKLIEVAIPVDQLPRSHADVLGQFPPPELVHHDGETTSMIFRESRSYKEVAKYFCQFDHRTGRFSDLVKLAALGERRYLRPIGVDPQEARFYFAVETWLEGGKAPVSLELSRIRLDDRAIDWQLTLDLPRRKQQLALQGVRFSHDGAKLALVEHDELDYPKANPPARVYVLDLAARTIDSYPATVSAYGATFSRDDRYLLLGSNELGEIVRIDLQRKQADLRTKAMRLIQGFALTPSGRSILVYGNTILGSSKVVEVRRVDTLALRTSVPVRLLFPGQDGVHVPFLSTRDGRTLVAPIPDGTGFPAGNGVRIYEVPDDVESPALVGTSPEALRVAQAAVAAKLHAAASRIELSTRPEEETRTPRPTFLPIVVAAGGDVLYAGIRSGNSDGDYKPGRTTPVVVRLDGSGKRRWEVSLAKKGFLEYGAPRIASTADGGCVAQVFSYFSPKGSPVTRLVKLDARGKTLWEVRLRGDGGLDTPLPDRLELLPDGSISLSGRIYPAKDVQKPWTGVVSADGKVVSDVVGE